MSVSLRDRIKAWITKLRGSAWTSIGGRIVLVGLALFVLAWIGRASAEPAMTPPSSAPNAMTAVTTATSTPSTVSTEDASAPPPSPLPPPAQSAPAPASHARASPTDPVYINEADAEELRRLPGVGAKRAEAILAHRRRVGRFQRVEELMRVKGIGRATIRKWRPMVRLESRPVDAGAPS